MMGSYSVTNVLTLSLLVTGVCSQEPVTFNRRFTGAKFLPYAKADGIDLSITLLATTTENIKTMLEVVSSKFSRILVNSVDADDVPYRRNFTYYHSTRPRARTAEMAALINRERNNLSLTVTVGIRLTWSSAQRSDTEVQVALESLEKANSIYPGTVNGLYLSDYKVNSIQWASETVKWLKYLRNDTSLNGIQLGTEQSCDESLIIDNLNKSDPSEIQIGHLRKEMISISDFIICFSSPGNNLLRAGASVAISVLSQHALKNRQIIRSINDQIDVQWSTYWEKLGEEETRRDYDNLGMYWKQANAFAERYSYPVWPGRTFGGFTSDIPWWRLTSFTDKSNMSAYVENYSGKRAGRQREGKIDSEASPSSKFTTTPKPTLEVSTSVNQSDANSDFSKYFGVAFGIIALLLLSVLVYLGYKRWSSSQSSVLTRQEIEEFRLGSIKTNPNIQNDYGSSVNMNALNLPYNTLLEIPKEKLEILSEQVLGGGEFGCVCKAVVRDETYNLKEVALKMSKPHIGATAIRGILSEIKILSYLGNHPNIVPILGAYTAEIGKGTVYVATELCPLGSLKDCLRNLRENTKSLKSNSGSTIPFHDMIRWSHEIACGMEYLEQKGVIHADLATRNVLLSSESVAKITDFGLSRRLYEYTNYTKTHQEPLPWRWMAIESLKLLEFSTKSDVWSYGVTLWEIFSLGGSPYPGLMWTIDFVEMLEDGLRLKRPVYATSNLYDIMVDCWQPDKDLRPTFTELRNAVRRAMETNANNDLPAPLSDSDNVLEPTSKTSSMMDLRQ